MRRLKNQIFFSAKHGNTISHLAEQFIKYNGKHRNQNVQRGGKPCRSPDYDKDPHTDTHFSSSFSPESVFSPGVFFFPPNSKMPPKIPPPTAMISISIKTIFSTISNLLFPPQAGIQTRKESVRIPKPRLRRTDPCAHKENVRPHVRDARPKRFILCRYGCYAFLPSLW